MGNLTNDLDATKLISKSLSGDLTEPEQAALNEYLDREKETRAFSLLSSMIHESTTDIAADDAYEDPGKHTGDGLSDIARERLRRAVRKAKSDSDMSNDVDAALKVAESETVYFTRNDSDSTNDRSTGDDECRQAVSRFTILQKIGQGGLGIVWLARDERLRRNVALKELSPHAAESPKLWQRFQREAEITSHLEHPNVVPLYMSGVNPETGMPFYAMRFVGKQTLADAISEYHARCDAGLCSTVDSHRLLNAFLGVCQAIAFAHSRGVIHRDLKPQNIAIDSFGQVLVLDWGLAKLDSHGELTMRIALSSSVGDGNLSQTLDGDVVGTPLYMAPEQAAGNLDDVDARTDIYGLGAVLFAILTGSAPHEDSNKQSDGTLRVQDFLNSIATSKTPRPRDLNASVPRDLEAICLRAMAKEKFARHATADELASDVEHWIAGKHEKETRYDAMRMTGRDLKSRLCVQVRQLAACAQFMVELPPIQGLLASMLSENEEFSTWRDRLSKILLALARSKPNISGLSYSQILDDRIHELVRVERSLHDVSNVRSLPQSRLRRGVANTFHRTVMQQFPGEYCIDFDCTTAGTVRFVCGVPVFDCESEEPFGLVCAEAEIENLVRPELDVIQAQDDVILIDDDSGQVLFTSKRDMADPYVPDREQRDGLFVDNEQLTRWMQRSSTSDDAAIEFIDPMRQHYATRLFLPQKNSSIQIVFANSD